MKIHLATRNDPNQPFILSDSFPIIVYFYLKVGTYIDSILLNDINCQMDLINAIRKIDCQWQGHKDFALLNK